MNPTLASTSPRAVFLAALVCFMVCAVAGLIIELVRCRKQRKRRDEAHKDYDAI